MIAHLHNLNQFPKQPNYTKTKQKWLVRLKVSLSKHKHKQMIAYRAKEQAEAVSAPKTLLLTLRSRLRTNLRSSKQSATRKR